MVCKIFDKILGKVFGKSLLEIWGLICCTLTHGSNWLLCGLSALMAGCPPTLMKLHCMSLFSCVVTSLKGRCHQKSRPSWILRTNDVNSLHRPHLLHGDLFSLLGDLHHFSCKFVVFHYAYYILFWVPMFHCMGHIFCTDNRHADYVPNMKQFIFSLQEEFPPPTK